MKEKNSEISLDEVLSSIKQMVIDEEPPILELTDMVSKDGSIVKIKKNCDTNPDMSSFLRLIQENANITELSDKTQTDSAATASTLKRCDSSANHKFRDEANPLISIIKEAISPILQKWMEENLRSIVTKVVEEEIKKFLYNTESKK